MRYEKHEPWSIQNFGERNKDFQGLLLPMKISILQFHVKVSRPFKCIGGERFPYCSTFLQEVLVTSNNGK